MIDAAIAGYGRWGRRLLAAGRDSGRFRFSVLVTRDPERLAEEAASIGAEAVGSLDAALARSDVGAVVLATPHSRHADEIARCGAAGRPVFVEKPVALTREAAAGALATCPPDLVVAAGHNRRFLPAVRRLADEIGAGALGHPLFAEANFSGDVSQSYAHGQWRASADESPAGGFAGAGIHMIDLILHLMGPVRRVSAVSARQALSIDMDDTTAALMELDSGAQAVVVSLMATRPTFRLKIFGTDGTGELADARTLVLERRDGRRETVVFPEVDTERLELAAFADAVEGQAPYPVTRDEILNGVAAFEAVGRAAATGARVELP